MAKMMYKKVLVGCGIRIACIGLALCFAASADSPHGDGVGGQKPSRPRARGFRNLKRVDIGIVAEKLPRFALNEGVGPLAAQAMLSVLAPHGADMAVLVPEQIHAPLRPGALSAFDCYRSCAWRDHLALVHLRPDQIRAMIEEILERRIEVFDIPAFVHAAGMRCVLDTSATRGKRVQRLEAGSAAEGYRLAHDGDRFAVAVTGHMTRVLKSLRSLSPADTASFPEIVLGKVLTDYLSDLAARGPIVNPREIRVKMTFARIAVISDPHYFAPSLLVNDGVAFQTYIAQDRKLIAESDALFRAALSDIRADSPEICIMPGDLTKDGELLSHEAVARLIEDSLESAGIATYVVPGNHDINNPRAYRYDGPTVTSVSSVSPDQYAEIYQHAGYGEALFRDRHSLSYIAEPANGLWLIGIDACDYDTNVGHSRTGGSLADSTLLWLTAKLDEADSLNITTLAFMHHGLTEHFEGQTDMLGGMFAEYVIDSWRSIRDTLADHGVRAICTGHYHAQDIVRYQSPAGAVLFDIETGSTVTWPCPIRTLDLRRGEHIIVSTRRINNIAYPTGGVTFQEYAKDYLQTGLTNLISYMLTGMFGVDQPQAARISPAITRAYMAHYAGDEMSTPEDRAVIAALKSSPDHMQRAIGTAMASLWDDPSPADNRVRLNLATGEASLE